MPQWFLWAWLLVVGVASCGDRGLVSRIGYYMPEATHCSVVVFV